MVSGKHSVNSIKIQLVIDKKNIFFARIKKPLWERLKIAIQGSKYSSRINWIKSESKKEFGLELKDIHELNQFNELLDSYNYEDSNDWLRTKIREYLKKNVGRG